MTTDVEKSVNITNHIKAGNTAEAAKLIETLHEFEKLVSAERCKKLLERASLTNMNERNMEALSTKLEMLEASIAANKDTSKLRK